MSETQWSLLSLNSLTNNVRSSTSLNAAKPKHLAPSVRVWVSLVALPHRHCVVAPSVTDEAFSIRLKHVIVLTYNLFCNNVLCSFEQSLLKFDIPRAHFYMCLQLGNLSAWNTDLFASCPCFQLSNRCKPSTKYDLSVDDIGVTTKISDRENSKTRTRKKGELACKKIQSVLLIVWVN